MEDERRRHPRVRLDGRAAGRATIFADFKVASLSEASAALEMDLPLALGSLCDLTLNLRQGQVDVWGKVSGVEPAGARFRVMVDFVRVDEADQPALQAYIAGERREGRT
jgi:hypothetical protein